MLVGITLPLYAVHFSSDAMLSFNALDLLATVGCIAGIYIAHCADTQLHEYVTRLVS